jgi:hypothetical protein
VTHAKKKKNVDFWWKFVEWDFTAFHASDQRLLSISINTQKMNFFLLGVCGI